MRQFKEFSATHLYCPNCKASMPVREVLLLVLPDGNLYDYRCLVCGDSLGTKKDKKNIRIDTIKERSQDDFRRHNSY